MIWGLREEEKKEYFCLDNTFTLLKSQIIFEAVIGFTSYTLLATEIVVLMCKMSNDHRFSKKSTLIWIKVILSYFIIFLILKKYQV